MRPSWICPGISVSYDPLHLITLLTVFRCHLGKSIVYDTVSNLSWSVDVRTHPIITVIEKILNEPWAPSVEIGREVPEAAVEEDCVVCSVAFYMFVYSTLISALQQECYRWEYGNFP